LRVVLAKIQERRGREIAVAIDTEARARDNGGR
jgi:hypothetical protein